MVKAAFTFLDDMSVSYSVIIPAYNEEAFLPETLAALKEAMNAVDLSGEVIVVDNNSRDRTPEIAGKHGARIVFEPVNQISRARNAGARAAGGRYLIFLDADTMISAPVLRKALLNLSGGACCGGGVRVVYAGRLPAVIRLGTDFWNFLSIRLGMAAGCFMYCLKEAYDAAGGFSETVYASEEIWFSWKVGAWGRARQMDFRIIDDSPLITSGRKLKWFSLVQIFSMVLLFCFFPFAVRFRALCSLWYERPDPKKGQ